MPCPPPPNTRAAHAPPHPPTPVVQPMQPRTSWGTSRRRSSAALSSRCPCSCHRGWACWEVSARSRASRVWCPTGRPWLQWQQLARCMALRCQLWSCWWGWCLQHRAWAAFKWPSSRSGAREGVAGGAWHVYMHSCASRVRSSASSHAASLPALWWRCTQGVAGRGRAGAAGVWRPTLHRRLAVHQPPFCGGVGGAHHQQVGGGGGGRTKRSGAVAKRRGCCARGASASSLSRHPMRALTAAPLTSLCSCSINMLPAGELDGAKCFLGLFGRQATSRMSAVT